VRMLEEVSRCCGCRRSSIRTESRLDAPDFLARDVHAVLATAGSRSEARAVAAAGLPPIAESLLSPTSCLLPGVAPIVPSGVTPKRASANRRMNKGPLSGPFGGLRPGFWPEASGTVFGRPTAHSFLYSGL